MRNEAIEIQICSLPHAAGVYFFYNQKEELVYVGKSLDIKNRVRQHFGGKDRKSQKIQSFTQRIAYEVMGSELISLLYESELIKQYKPIYNRAQRRTVYQYGLYLDQSTMYKKLLLSKIDNSKQEITSFGSLMEGKKFLFHITELYRLCQKINELQKTGGSCFQFQVKACFGACIGKESAEDYNKRVDDFLNKYVIQQFTKMFTVSGRSELEEGIVYIENGVYKGFGFCHKSTPENEKLKYIVSRQDNKDVRRILMRHFMGLHRATEGS